jgi:suppressor for copper-sensitivity B
LIALPAAASAATSPWQTNEHGSVRLIAAEAELAPGEAPLRLGVQFRTAPGWHVYWKNPGDAGFPPRVDLLAPPNLVGKEPTIEIEYPAPHRFSLPGGLFAIGYEGEIVYPLKPRPYSPPAGAQSVRIEADVDYLTCEVDCVPYRYRLALDLPVARAAVDDPRTAPLLDQAEASLPRRDGTLPGVAVRAELAPRPTALVVEIAGVEASPASDLFVEPQDLFEIGRPVVSQVPGGVRFELSLSPRRSDLALPERFPLAFAATGLVHAGAPIALEARRELDLKAAPVALDAPLWGWAPWLAALASALTAAAMVLWKGGASSLSRGLLGFIALGLAVVCLRLLAERVTPLGLAGIELALLGLGLGLWLRGRMAGRRFAGAVALSIALAAALAAPWLAAQQRLPAGRSDVVRPADSTVNRGEGT